MTRLCPATKLDCRNECGPGEACLLWPSVPFTKPTGLVPQGDEWQELMLLRRLYVLLQADPLVAPLVAVHVRTILHPAAV
jgi:hypothetical protein